MTADIDPEHAAKDRIIKHLNNDHHDSVIRYLQHYAQVPSWKAYDGKVVHISMRALELSYHGNTVTLPFVPPMETWREARERVVIFDKECVEALGVSDVTVKRYLPPTGSYMAPFLIILGTLLVYSQRRWHAEGQLVERAFGSTFARFSSLIQPYLFGGLISIHAVEALVFAYFKLAKHSVNVRSPIWWLWTASVLIEGQFAYRRFDDHVQMQRKKQKH